jgi:hypothetical protein
MKDTRETSAGLFLAFESGAYAKVLAGEARALEALAGMRGALEAARAASGPAAAPRR